MESVSSELVKKLWKVGSILSLRVLQRPENEDLHSFHCGQILELVIGGQEGSVLVWGHAIERNVGAYTSLYFPHSWLEDKNMVTHPN